MTENELFEKFVSAELDLLALKEDVKAIAEDAKEQGFDKKQISLLKASAKIHVANTFEEKEEAARELEETYKRVTGYDQ